MMGCPIQRSRSPKILDTDHEPKQNGSSTKRRGRLLSSLTLITRYENEVTYSMNQGVHRHGVATGGKHTILQPAFNIGYYEMDDRSRTEILGTIGSRKSPTVPTLAGHGEADGIGSRNTGCSLNIWGLNDS